MAHFCVVQVFSLFCLKGDNGVFEIPGLNQIPHCVQISHVQMYSALLEMQCLKINSWEALARGFTSLLIQDPMCSWNRAGNAGKCFIGGSTMFCLNCLWISFVFLFFFLFILLNTFLVHWLQKPTRNYATEYCFLLFFYFLFFISIFFLILMSWCLRSLQ